MGYSQKTGRKRNASRLVTSRLWMVAMLGSMLGSTLFTTEASLAAPQPAVFTTAGGSDQIVVLPDSGAAPTTQSLVSGLPTGAKPHGVAFYGRDNALIGDFNSSRIFVVRVSDATLLATINTTSVGYDGSGTIAVSPNQSTALAMGTILSSNNLYVIPAPFNASSPITSVTLSGYLAGYQTQAIVFNKAGRAFVRTNAGIEVLDAPYTSVAFTIPNLGDGAIAITPDGNTLLTTDFDTNTVRIFQAPFSAASTPTSLTIPSGDGLDGIVMAPDGQKAIVVSAYVYHAAAISAPFTSSSLVEDLPLPTNGGDGFEDLSISADGQMALLAGRSDDPSEQVVLIKAPFTAAGATSSKIPVQNVSNPTRGGGSVRFRPNFAAVAVGNSYAVNENSTLTVPAAGVLTNDTDIDGDTLTASLVTGPLHGTLTLNANGSFSYTPDANYSGSDSFSYKANDGIADSNIVTVNITVNEVIEVNVAPVASSQSLTVAANTPRGITLVASDADNDNLTFTIVSGPSHGTLSGGFGNFRTYTPAANYVGPDSFTFKANDGTVDSNIATVTINVEGPLNVSSGIVIERGLFIAAEPLPGNFGLRKQVQFVTLKNKSGAAISGPVYLALDNLTRANLTNGSGFTTKAPFGSPYVQVNVGNDGVFSVNEKVTVQLNFTPTSFGTISYNTRLLAGSGTP